MNRRQRKRKHAKRRAHGRSGQRPRNVVDRDSYPPVKHGHIVPRTYQLNFAIDDHVAVHAPSKSPCLRLHVDNAGTRRYFYRRLRPDRTHIDDIEASLSDVEHVAGPVLKELAAGAELTLPRKGILAEFMGLQMLRGPRVLR